MEDKIIELTEKSMGNIANEGLTTNNLEHLYKLTKIRHIVKEDKNMYGNYGEYGRRPMYDSYGNYGEYGRRGRDMKYRGEEHLERMMGEYGRYQENRSRYGNNEDTDKSFYYMVEAYKDFTKVLFEEAETPQQQQMLREAIQQSMR